MAANAAIFFVYMCCRFSLMFLQIPFSIVE